MAPFLAAHAASCLTFGLYSVRKTFHTDRKQISPVTTPFCLPFTSLF